MQPITIGYWRRAQSPDSTALPWPIENSVEDGTRQDAIVQSLIKAFASSKLTSYRGSSVCRLCGIRNGSKELQVTSDGFIYRIPEGYLHYLTHHRVGADPRLLAIL
jgi:hypothetical protein